MSTQTLKVIICIIYYAKFKRFSIGDTIFDYSSSVAFFIFVTCTKQLAALSVYGTPEVPEVIKSTLP